HVGPPPSTGKRMAAPAPDPQFTLRGAGSAVCALHFCSGAQGRPLLLSGGSPHGRRAPWRASLRTHVGQSWGCWRACVTAGRGALLGRTQHTGASRLDSGRGPGGALCAQDVTPPRLPSRLGGHACLNQTSFWKQKVPSDRREQRQVQILELPSKTLVSCLKPEAGARLGMPMCLQLWQVRPCARPRPSHAPGRESCPLGTVLLVPLLLCLAMPSLPSSCCEDACRPRGRWGSAGPPPSVPTVNSPPKQATSQVRGTHELTNPGIADLKIRPDSKILATAGWDHRVRVFQWRTMRPLAVLAFHSATVHCVAFDATGLLAAGSGDQRISVWSLYP
ncbi:hypothetical protein K5549_019855, partial [Capra hircus]